MSDCRKAFEAWARKHAPHLSLYCDDDGAYSTGVSFSNYQGWKAAWKENDRLNAKISKLFKQFAGYCIMTGLDTEMIEGLEEQWHGVPASEVFTGLVAENAKLKADLADAVAAYRNYQPENLTDLELVEIAVAGAIEGIDDHFTVEAMRVALKFALASNVCSEAGNLHSPFAWMPSSNWATFTAMAEEALAANPEQARVAARRKKIKDAMGRRDTPICFSEHDEILPDGKTAHYKEIVQALESAGRKCFERGGNVRHDNPYPHGGDNHSHWFVGFAEAKQKANPEPADEPLWRPGDTFRNHTQYVGDRFAVASHATDTWELTTLVVKEDGYESADGPWGWDIEDIEWWMPIAEAGLLFPDAKPVKESR